MRIIQDLVKALFLIALSGGVCSSVYSIEHDIPDLEHTLADNLTTEQNAIVIDHFMTYYPHHTERYSKVRQLCQNRELVFSNEGSDNRDPDTGETEKKNISIASCDDFLDNLIIQLNYTIDGFADNHPLWASEKRKGLNGRIMVKDQLMRTLGVIFAIIRPENGESLSQTSVSTVPSNPYVSLTADRVSLLVAALTKMQNVMGDDLYWYEYAEDNNGTPRHLYTIPIYWTSIVSDLTAAGLLHYQSLPDGRPGKVGLIMLEMYKAHAQASCGIVAARESFGNKHMLKTTYDICLEGYHYPDKHSYTPSETSFKNYNNALEIPDAAATVAKDQARAFLERYGIEWEAATKPDSEEVRAKINATKNSILAGRAWNILE